MSHLKICAGKSCSDHGSPYLADRARAEAPEIEIEMCGCLGQCEQAPTVVLSGTMHHHMTGPELAKLIKRK